MKNNSSIFSRRTIDIQLRCFYNAAAYIGEKVNKKRNHRKKDCAVSRPADSCPLDTAFVVSSSSHSLFGRSNWIQPASCIQMSLHFFSVGPVRSPYIPRHIPEGNRKSFQGNKRKPSGTGIASFGNFFSFLCYPTGLSNTHPWSTTVKSLSCVIKIAVVVMNPCDESLRRSPDSRVRAIVNSVRVSIKWKQKI